MISEGQEKGQQEKGQVYLFAFYENFWTIINKNKTVGRWSKYYELLTINYFQFTIVLFLGVLCGWFNFLMNFH